MARSLAAEGDDVVLVSKDLNLRLKADVLGIPAEDLLNDKVDFESLYKGCREIYLEADDIESFYQNGALRLSKRRRTGHGSARGRRKIAGNLPFSLISRVMRREFR